MLPLLMSMIDEHELFDKIYKQYVFLVLHIAHNILSDFELANDAAQETFIRVFKGMDHFDASNENKLKTWICIIAKNVSIDILRKRNRENQELIGDETMFENIESGESDFTEIFTIKELTNEIYKIIKEFDEKYKDVIMMKYYLGFHNDEIARMLNIPTGTVAVRLHRAKNMILNTLHDRAYRDDFV